MENSKKVSSDPFPNEVSADIEFKGLSPLRCKGTAITLAGKPEDTNSISQPRAVPITGTVRGVKPKFTYKLSPYSIVVLKLKI